MCALVHGIGRYAIVDDKTQIAHDSEHFDNVVAIVQHTAELKCPAG